jgi:peptidyl-prolyl cis-trans isomerase NIMA-interacting 1
MAFRACLHLLRLLPRAGASFCVLVLQGATTVNLGCADLTRPPPHRRLSADAIARLEPAPSPTPPLAAALAPSPQPPTVPAAAEASAGQVSASHILVAYRGATRAKPTVTRSKEEARALAQSLATEALEPGTDFSKLARDRSDGPSGIEGGALPKFGRQQMVKPFSDAAFALQPGEISELVETNFGFHIIKRTE